MIEFLQPAPIKKASAEDLILFAEVKKQILNWKSVQPTRFGTTLQEMLTHPLNQTSEGYFWLIGGEMLAAVQAYEYSRDPAFLDVFVEMMEKALAQRYVHPTMPDVWVGWFHYKPKPHNPRYYMPMHGGLIYYNPCLRFIAAVRADEKLKAKYGKKAEKWFKDIIEVEIPAWDKRDQWHELGNGEGWYTKLKVYPDPNTGRLKPLRKKEAGTTLANNKVQTMLEGFCLAYRMTGDPWFKERIEKCERFLRNRWREDEKHVEWNYRDFSGPWDYSDNKTLPKPNNHFQYKGRRTWKWFNIHPKGAYYDADIRAIVDCYNIGIIFTKKDMENLVKTNNEFMFRGNEQNPLFKNIDGKTGRGVLWQKLAQFSPKTRKLWKATIVNNHIQAHNRHRNIMKYLIETSRPVSWKPLYVNHIPNYTKNK